MGGNTVRRAARAETPEQMLNGRQRPRPSQLDPFKSHVDKLWAEGCTNAIHLHAELQKLGYQGSYAILSEYLRPRHRRGGTVATTYQGRRPGTAGRPSGHRLADAPP